MVTSVLRRPWYRLRIDGEQVELAADPVQNELLETSTTYVLDAEIATDGLTFDTTLPVDLYAVEQEAATIAAQFAGVVNHVSAQSFPNRVVLTCTGPLAKLRRVTTSGRDLTGMTDGEAVQEILDSCNVDYDPDDIQDAGYVLGAEASVHWLKDQTGAEIVAELDRVFGMATIEVGAGRVVRFAYDRAPDDAAIGVTYTRGVDAAFWRNQRDRGDLDAIVNVVQVTGASWEDANNCTLTPWARGVANNADLGGTVRARSMGFSSDLIQDEALAEAIATRLLRWYNRQPDDLTVVALNDPNVHPGDVIGVKDQAYGVDLTADADATPYLVLAVDRRGDEMTLTCVGGAAGDTGTITTGVEKVCNQTSTDVAIPGSFAVPDILTPPAIPLLDYDPLTDGAPGVPGDAPPSEGGGGGEDSLLGVDAANWVQVTATFSAAADHLNTNQTGYGRYTDAVDCAEDWSISATLDWDAATSAQNFVIGIGTSGGAIKYGVTVLDTGGVALYADTNTLNEAIDGPPYLVENTTVQIELSWDAALELLTYSADDGITLINGTLDGSGGLPGVPVYPLVGSDGTPGDTGGIDVTTFDFTGTLI